MGTSDGTRNYFNILLQFSTYKGVNLINTGNNTKICCNLICA